VIDWWRRRWSRIFFSASALAVIALATGLPSSAETSDTTTPLTSVTRHQSRLERPAFPLHAPPGGRYLVDSAGKPFLINGDAPWSLIVQLTDEEVDRYLDDRQRKGFNTVLVNLLEHKFSSMAPRNAYGETPFTKPGDFGTPNEKYFTHADEVLRKAADRGILVLLAPAYLGYEGGDEGWWSEMKASGIAKLRQYGRYVGNRYRQFQNVIWVQGGDYDPPIDGQALVTAVARGIRDVDPRLQTFHGAPGTSALEYWGDAPSWLNVNTIYTLQSAGDVAEDAHAAFRQSRMPFFLIEAAYENEGVGAAGVRQQAYQAILGGGFGSVMGNRPIWLFDNGWQQALNSPGSFGLSRVGQLFRSLRWWLLVPDVGHVFLTGDIGTAADETVAARARDGSFAVVYAPSSRQFALDLSRLRGPMVTARWFDPVNGKYRAVSGSPFRSSGQRQFSTPRTNAGGDGDFVLLLSSSKR
jgi:hypothetical protein